MKLVAAVFADFEHAFLGGPAQLLRELHGQPLLRHTLQRLLRVEGLDARCLFVRPAHQAAAAEALRAAGLAGRIDVLALDQGTRPRRALLRSARKWSLDGWRGGLLGATWFDEYVEPYCVAQVLDHYRADAVLCLDAYMPALSPEIAATMLARCHEYQTEAGLVFTQAPPGLAGVILRRELVAELLQQDVPLGLLLAYRPESPRGDPINRPPCAPLDLTICHTAARLTGDTRRSRELLARAFAALGADASPVELCAWLRDTPTLKVAPLPREVELELTTADPLPATTLHPRGDRAPPRHLTDLAAVEHLARQLAAYDDSLVVLGGHGDPLMHPQFAEICRILRQSGVCGLAVVTPLVELSETNLTTLLDQQVDVVQVRLDADCAATYRTINNADRFNGVIENIHRIERARHERLSPQPLVVPSLTRCAAAIADMESFFDRWITNLGWATIEGYSDYCGALAQDTLLHAGPQLREPCRRLNARAMFLADGAATLCNQDHRGAMSVGRWTAKPVPASWHGDELTAIRQFHAQRRWDDLPLCRTCREWFRP